MTKTYKKRGGKKQGTRRELSSSSQSFSAFQKEVTIVFLETLLMIKLYHWKTYSYATHKATDDAYSKLNTNMDSFVEILLGKSQIRTDLTNQKDIRLIDCKTQEDFIKGIISFKGFLINLDDNKIMKSTLMLNPDLYTIRDEILGDMNQLLYLLSFK
jgi:hypothetical protein